MRKRVNRAHFATTKEKKKNSCKNEQNINKAKQNYQGSYLTRQTDVGDAPTTKETCNTKPTESSPTNIISGSWNLGCWQRAITDIHTHAHTHTPTHSPRTKFKKRQTCRRAYFCSRAEFLLFIGERLSCC